MKFIYFIFYMFYKYRIPKVEEIHDLKMYAAGLTSFILSFNISWILYFLLSLKIGTSKNGPLSFILIIFVTYISCLIIFNKNKKVWELIEIWENEEKSKKTQKLISFILFIITSLFMFYYALSLHPKEEISHNKVIPKTKTIEPKGFVITDPLQNSINNDYNHSNKRKNTIDTIK
jgi:hypothetical protein